MRVVTFAEYTAMDDEQRSHVTVVNFTGLTDLDERGTLGVEQRAGGSSAPSDPKGRLNERREASE